MNLLTHIFAAIGLLTVAVPFLLIGLIVGCHFLAKWKRRRDARLTALKTQ